jgi:hypothetical protein
MSWIDGELPPARRMRRVHRTHSPRKSEIFFPVAIFAFGVVAFVLVLLYLGTWLEPAEQHYVEAPKPPEEHQSALGSEGNKTEPYIPIKPSLIRDDLPMKMGEPLQRRGGIVVEK